MQNEQVSVVIPYFNAGQTIGRAVHSVLAQTVHPAEIIVVDDGSSENAAAALREFGSDVTLIRKPNGGAASARNTAIERARGEWIAFLDADDYWEPTKLEIQLACSKHVGLIGSKWFMESPNGIRSLTDSLRNELYGKICRPQSAQAFQFAAALWTGVVLVRRSVLGKMRFLSGLEPAEDRDLWLRLVVSTSVYIVPHPLATYVQYTNSLSNNDPERDCRSMLKVLHRHAALLTRRELRKQEALLYRRWAGCQLARGRPEAAVHPALARLAIEPVSTQAWWIVGKTLTRCLFSNANR